jgi:predicted dehydrogenase
MEGMISQLRFALLGCGRIAQRHVDCLTSGALPGAKLTAVCDINFERAKAIAAKFGVPGFANQFEMLEQMGSEIDVVSILTPSGLHAKHAIEVANFRKHLVVEKPIALALEDADKMIEACNCARVHLFVVNQNRFNYPVRKMRQALEGGRFGKLVLGTVRVRWCRTQKYYDQDSWRGTWAYDGGVFANQAWHHVDLLRWMMGEVESVIAKTSTALVDIETEDTGVVVLRFKSGALGVIEATTATRPKDLEASLSILGEKGSAEIGGFAVNEMKVWNFTEPQPDDADVLQKYRINPPSVYGFGHTEYLKNVVESIREGQSALVEGIEARKSLELISAIYRSVKTGKEVFLMPTTCHANNCSSGNRAAILAGGIFR